MRRTLTHPYFYDSSDRSHTHHSASDGHRVLQPGEIASFTATWDQMHFEGGRAAAGRYIAQVHLANVATNRGLSPGPQAELILE